MKGERVTNPPALFHELGGLHDAEIRRIEFNPENRTLTLALSDLHANFEELPGDPGRRPCALQFTGVMSLRVNVDVAIDQAIYVSDLIIQEIDTGFRMAVQLRLGGGSLSESIVATFENLYIQQP